MQPVQPTAPATTAGSRAATVTATRLAIAAVGAYVGAQVIASVKIGSTKGAVSALSLPLIYLSPDRDWRANPDDA